MRAGPKFFRKRSSFMRPIRVFIAFSASIGVLLAQDDISKPGNSAQPAIEVKRRTAHDTQRQSIPPLLQQYDFGAQIQALQQANGLPVSSDVVPEFATATDRGTTAPGSVPKEYRPKVDVPL